MGKIQQGNDSPVSIGGPVASPPTLGYVLKGYPRISETFISNEILLLERLGFTLHLFPMRQPRESFCHDSVAQIRAQVSYLPTELLLDFKRLLRPNLLLAATKPKAFAKALRFAGAGTAGGSKLPTLKHLFQAGFMTYHHLLQSHVIHLHGHFAHSPTSVTLFASILADLPFSFTAHAKDIYTSREEKLRRKIERAEFVVTCTEHNAKFLRKLASGLSTPIHCVYHGIDVNLFSSKKLRAAPVPPYRFLTVARMTEKKGLPTIYQALRLLKDQGLAFTHTLIGEGDDRRLIEQLIVELDLADQCQLLGTRTHAEVLVEFSRCDVFLLGCEIAKNGDRDGIPNVLVESLAMGVPAVSTTVSAIPEVLIDGETGRTVSPGDAKAFAKATLELLVNQQLRDKIIAAGREEVLKRFDNRHHTRELARIFQKTHPTLTKQRHDEEN